MTLRQAVDLFCLTRSPEVLKAIKKRYGGRGFSIACKAAGISRGQGKRMIGVYDDAKAIKQVANQACGMRISRW